MKQDIHDIASFFINKGVSPLKLQKLLYYSQVWGFVKTGAFVFDEPIRNWVYGPVVKEVWSKYKYMRKGRNIHKDYGNYLNLKQDTINHLDEVWNAYGHLSPFDLVELTHSEMPWLEKRKGLHATEPSDKVLRIDKNTTQYFILENKLIPKAESITNDNRPLHTYYRD